MQILLNDRLEWNGLAPLPEFLPKKVERPKHWLYTWTKGEEKGVATSLHKDDLGFRLEGSNHSWEAGYTQAVTLKAGQPYKFFVEFTPEIYLTGNQQFDQWGMRVWFQVGDYTADNRWIGKVDHHQRLMLAYEFTPDQDKDISVTVWAQQKWAIEKSVVTFHRVSLEAVGEVPEPEPTPEPEPPGELVAQVKRFVEIKSEIRDLAHSLAAFQAETGRKIDELQKEQSSIMASWEKLG